MHDGIYFYNLSLSWQANETFRNSVGGNLMPILCNERIAIWLNRRVKRMANDCFLVMRKIAAGKQYFCGFICAGRSITMSVRTSKSYT